MASSLGASTTQKDANVPDTSPALCSEGLAKKSHLSREEWAGDLLLLPVCPCKTAGVCTFQDVSTQWLQPNSLGATVWVQSGFKL